DARRRHHSGWVCICVLPLSSHVKLDREDTALPDHALYVYNAPHQLDQPFTDNQSNARSPLGTSLLPEPVERLEQLAYLNRRKSIPGVLDTNANPPGASRNA